MATTTASAAPRRRPRSSNSRPSAPLRLAPPRPLCRVSAGGVPSSIVAPARVSPTRQFCAQPVADQPPPGQVGRRRKQRPRHRLRVAQHLPPVRRRQRRRARLQVAQRPGRVAGGQPRQCQAAGLHRIASRIVALPGRICGQRRLIPALQEQRMPQIVVPEGEVRGQGNHATEGRLRLPEPAQFPADHAQIVQGLVVLRIGGEGSSEGGEGLVGAVKLAERRAPVGGRRGEVRHQGRGGAERRGGSLHVVAAQPQLAQLEMRRRPVGCRGDRLGSERGGVVQVVRPPCRHWPWPAGGPGAGPRRVPRRRRPAVRRGRDREMPRPALRVAGGGPGDVPAGGTGSSPSRSATWRHGPRRAAASGACSLSERRSAVATSTRHAALLAARRATPAARRAAGS